MFGPPLALMSRALRMDARLMRTHVFRLLFVGLVFGSLLFAHMMSWTIGAPGLWFFQSITWLNFTFITLAAISFFATAVTEEKDEGTLGLLRMAGISPVALLLGKSTTRLVAALMVLVVQIPFTLLAVTLGGVTLHQILAAYAALAAYMVLVANIGLLCSVFSSGSGRAAGLTCVLMLLFLLGAPLVASLLAPPPPMAAPVVWTTVEVEDEETGETVSQLMRQPGPVPAPSPRARWREWGSAAAARVTAANVAPRLVATLQTGFSETFGEYVFSYQVVSNLGGALALFLLSWATFGRFTEERSTALRRLGNLLALRAGPPRWLRPRRAWGLPLVWKDYHFIAGGRQWLLLKLAAYATIVGVIAWLVLWPDGRPFRPAWDTLGASIMVAMLVAAVVELSLYASRIFREEVASKTLGLLMYLPYSTAAICWSKTLGCLLGLFPAAAYFALGAALNPAALVEGVEALVKFPFAWYYIGMFVIFLHVAALMSLMVKWGSLPLSLFVVYVFQSCCIGPMAMPFMFLTAMPGTQTGYEVLMAMPIIALTAVVSAALQVCIAQRLEKLAAE